MNNDWAVLICSLQFVVSNIKYIVHFSREYTYYNFDCTWLDYNKYLKNLHLIIKIVMYKIY